MEDITQNRPVEVVERPRNWSGLVYTIEVHHTPEQYTAVDLTAHELRALRDKINEILGD